MIETYITRIATRYATGIAREHSYRGDLQTLLETLNPGVLVTNEPARVACGAPDYILTRSNIPVGDIEAKDIGVSLARIDSSVQLTRYKAGLDNLMLTDYCEFWFYRDGKKVDATAIAEIRNRTIVPIPEAFERFTQLLQDFCRHIGHTITSAQKLAKMMAGKAKLMLTVIESALKSDEDNEQNSTLHAQMRAFKKILIHDISPAEFADMYAQTLAYGMFAARLHDPSLETFTRQEAAELIPKTNPFLRKLFNYIAGIDIDTRLVWIVDGLADIFRATDVAEMLQHFGNTTHTHDPIIHFYETFLAAYNPKLRKSRGVWYTPEPVVNFIVRAVDEILKTEFGLAQGLADTSAMAHLKLELLLRETGYEAETEQRLRVFLTNSLEEAHPDTGTFWAHWLSQEATEANYIKHETPVMVVLGNPPYAISSSNKGEWIQGVLNDYKQNLNEKKLNLDDDYIKFIRYGEYFIEKNGEGILAYISNNSFLDGITHRQMRRHLLETFDKIYILDLHGE